MKIYPLSDIHLELTNKDWKLPDPLPQFDVMVVAGDLCPHMDRGVEWLVQNVPDTEIVYIAGNHEFYDTDIDATVRKAKTRASGTRVHVLSDDAVTLLGTTFIGSTLWTDFGLLSKPEYAAAVAGEMMNDYRKIRVDGHARRLRPSDTLARHVRSRAFIRDELAKPSDGSRRVVVTHHGIHRQAVRPGMRGDLLSAAYASAMDEYVAGCGADIWIYGHTHISDDRMIGSTRVVSNGKGYGPLGAARHTHDNASFDPHLVIEI